MIEEIIKATEKEMGLIANSAVAQHISRMAQKDEYIETEKLISDERAGALYSTSLYLQKCTEEIMNYLQRKNNE